MSETSENQPNPEPPAGEVLAHISTSDADTSLQAAPPAASHRKDAGQPAPAASSDTLARPRGALIAMRKSGGLFFTWRLLVVHQDGRLIYKSNEIDAPEKARVIGALEAPQLTALQQLIAQTDFNARAYGARQNPDAYAYEIIARVGRKNKYAEVFEGGVPAALKPLIAQLNALLPGATPAAPEADAATEGTAPTAPGDASDKPAAEDE